MRSHSNTVRKNQRLFVEKQKEYKRIHLNVLLRTRFNMKVISILSKFYIKKYYQNNANLNHNWTFFHG